MSILYATSRTTRWRCARRRPGAALGPALVVVHHPDPRFHGVRRWLRAGARIALGRVLAEQGELDQAEATLRQALEAGLNHPTRRQAGDAYFELAKLHARLGVARDE